MKFTCLQENLSKGLSIVNKAIPTKASLPILSNVLITAKNGKLKLSANNLETVITTFVNASIEEEGAVTVPAKLLSEFVSHLSPDTLEVELKLGMVHITAGKTKSKFNGTNPKDFPDLPEIPEKANFINVDPKDFAASVNYVAFASAIDTTRPILSGVLINYVDDVLTLASTDGFRLSEKIIPLKSDSDDMKVVVPARTLNEVARLFASSTEPLKIILDKDDNLVVFESGPTLVATRILDGEYPDYKKIIPSENTIKAEFASADIIEAVKLANVFAKELDSVIKMILDPIGKITLTSQSQETGENKSEFEADVTAEELLEIAFSSKYLLDFLNTVKTEKLIFETKSNVSPGLLKTLDDTDFVHIIMPMRIQD